MTLNVPLRHNWQHLLFYLLLSASGVIFRQIVKVELLFRKR